VIHFSLRILANGALLPSRRTPPLPDTASVLEQIDRLAASPLKEIAERLRKDLSDAEASTRSGHTAAADFILVYNRVKELLAGLPSSFGQRFFFDAALIQALSETWSSTAVKIPQMVIPRPAAVSATDGMALSEDERTGQRIFFMMIPGRDDLADIDLRTYPFMCHELVHVLLFKVNGVFTKAFESELDEYVRKLRLSSAADRGIARNRSKEAAARIEKLWRPTPNHKNWSHELAIDVIALWTTGPAYLDAYRNAIEVDTVQPYEVVQTHPPHAVRVQAMIHASKELGWPIQALEGKLAGWKKAFRTTNPYASAANQEVILAGVRAALSTCQTLRLPKCTPDRLKETKALIHRGETPSFGMDVIWSAWIKSASPHYDEWEADFIAGLLGLIR